MALRTISSSSTSRMRPGWVESRISLAIISRRRVFGEMHTTFRTQKEIFKEIFSALALRQSLSHYSTANSDEKKIGPAPCRKRKKNAREARAFARAVVKLGLEGSAGRFHAGPGA